MLTDAHVLTNNLYWLNADLAVILNITVISGEYEKTCLGLTGLRSKEDVLVSKLPCPLLPFFIPIYKVNI